MKATEITAGGVYYDGKVGVREIVSIVPGPQNTSDQHVTYSIRAAKVEQEYSYAEKKMVSTIGTTSHCNLTSFSQWAKSRVEEKELQQLLIDLRAKKVHLPPGEKAFMFSLGEEYMGCSIEFAFNETRSARSVEKKGLVEVKMAGCSRGGVVTLTDLGAAWMRENQQTLKDAGEQQ